MAAIVHAQNPELQQLQTNYATVRGLEMKPLNDLQASYRTKLTAMIESGKAAGNLDAVVLIQKEMDEFATSPVALPANAPLALSQAQGIYVQYRDRLLEGLRKKLAAVDGRYLEQLDALEKKMTQSSQIEDALKVREAADTLRKELAAAGAAAPSPASVTSPTEIKGALNGDLIAHWRLDGDYEDRKRTHNGAGQGPTPPSFAEGRIGKAVALGADGNVGVVPHEELDLGHPFTIALWTKLEFAKAKDGFAKGLISKSNESWSMQFDKNGLSFLVRGDTISLAPVVPMAKFPDGVWIHIVATFTGKEAAIYVNGVKEASNASDKEFFPKKQPRAQVRIGSNFTSYFWWYYGLVDDVRIYKKVLTPEQIQALAQGAS
jgi:hypothetical protein